MNLQNELYIKKSRMRQFRKSGNFFGYKQEKAHLKKLEERQRRESKQAGRELNKILMEFKNGTMGD